MDGRLAMTCRGSIVYWTTPDPLGMVDGPNLYAYLNNDPLNSIDPWGLCEGTGFGGWADSLTYFGDWVIGKSMPNYYDIDTVQVQNMKNAPGVQEAKEYFRKKNAGKPWNKWEKVTDYPAKFGLKGLGNAGFNSTRQFVGSYSVDIYSSKDGVVNIYLTNTTILNLFLMD